VTDALREEHAALQRAVKQSRRQFTASDSAFVRDGWAAMDDYQKMRQEGVSRDDAVKGIEAVIRSAWPKAVSKFSSECQACDDTGWHEQTCWSEQRCTRKGCVDNPAREHQYVSACYCPKGDRFKPKQYAPEDEIAAVGRTQRKPKGFTRYGR
jgi:hypothetical protein